MNKIVAFYGSGRKNGNTASIINEILKGVSSDDVEISRYNVVDMDIKPCRGCYYCRRNDSCCLKDDMKNIIDDIKDANVVIFSSPLYMYQVAGHIKMLVDRLYPL
ncbi:flavodoxin family protein [Romboutsia sp. CE17]|uniref:flavodoxin family protein n=1 Tax=Romboutsia sp. CE17 TaxID=2724150 RepID=UPI001442D143|nr:flavodoxin family protein [Romboutsia sp. CE17]QJA07674.1 flavodoxin family protein [Romboutsia sp. CE17]